MCWIVDENNSNNLEDNGKDPAPFIEMGEDSKELTEEDFDFSGAFKMSEPLPGAKSEKGRSIWVHKWFIFQTHPVHWSLFDSGIHYHTSLS